MQLKSPNILLDANGRCKVADFGLSKLVSGTAASDVVAEATETGDDNGKSVAASAFQTDGGTGPGIELPTAPEGGKFAGFQYATGKSVTRTMTTGVGSLAWLCPELIEATRNRCKYGPSVDVYRSAISIVAFAQACLRRKEAPCQNRP